MEEKKDISELTGAVFQDGPYRYVIKLRQAKVGADTLNSVTITITNLTKVVKGDIILLALQRLKQYLKGDDEVGITAVYCTETDALGNYIPLLRIPHNAFNMEPLDTQLIVATKYVDNAVDLEENLRIAGIRKTKVDKVFRHMQNTMKEFEGHKIDIDTVDVQPKLIPTSKGLLPRLQMDVYVKIDYVNLGYDTDLKLRIKKHIEDTFEQYCPIDIKKEDNLFITTH